MIAQARKKASERQATIRFEEADAEQLPFAAASFDIALSRHLLWTLPNPDRAVDEWIRVLRPGGRLIIIDSQADVSASPEPLDNARRSPEYAAIGDRLPFVSGWPCEEIERLFAAHRLANITRASEKRQEEDGEASQGGW